MARGDQPGRVRLPRARGKILSDPTAPLSPDFFARCRVLLRNVPGVSGAPTVLAKGTPQQGVAMMIVDGALVSEAEIIADFMYGECVMGSFGADPQFCGARDDLYCRPLVFAEFHLESPTTLQVDLLQVHGEFHGHGIGTTLYQTLQAIAARFACRYLIHTHASDGAAEYILRRGAYLYHELQPQAQQALPRVDLESGEYHTVYFLDPAEAMRAVQPGVVGGDPAQRLQRARKINSN